VLFDRHPKIMPLRQRRQKENNKKHLENRNTQNNRKIFLGFSTQEGAEEKKQGARAGTEFIE
jgi:hypothetical protein